MFLFMFVSDLKYLGDLCLMVYLINSFHQKIGLKFKEGVNTKLNLEHIFV
jgi:hypothetical protein